MVCENVASDSTLVTKMRVSRLPFGKMPEAIIWVGGNKQNGQTVSLTPPFLDVGTSQMIVDGKIKLKNDSLIERFTAGGLKFENGSELPADVVVFATG